MYQVFSTDIHIESDMDIICECIVTKYNKQPASAGGSLKVEVEMKPKDTGFFEETVTVRCNTSTPLKLTIKGQATD